MAPVSVTQQARVLTGLAIAGAVPMTAGTILWLTGTAMGSAYHGHWARTAGLGEALLLAGLLCGLGMFVFAAVAERWTPRQPEVPPTHGGQDLMPLAAPEHQAFLAGTPPPPEPPPYPALPRLRTTSTRHRHGSGTVVGPPAGLGVVACT
jgi:hypothetical protein